MPDTVDKVDFNTDFFTLLQLERCFAIDQAQLDLRCRDLLTEVHPDRYVNATEAEKRLAMQWATQANEALQTLRKPLPRAAYLLHLAGHDVAAESNTAMPADFLMEQMEWREAVAEARASGNHHELERLHHRLREHIDASYAEIGQLLDDAADYPTAADRVRRMMFLEKLLQEIDNALVTFDE